MFRQNLNGSNGCHYINRNIIFKYHKADISKNVLDFGTSQRHIVYVLKKNEFRTFETVKIKLGSRPASSTEFQHS